MGGKGLIAHLVVVMCIDNVPHLLCSSLSDTSTHPVGMLAGWIGRHRKPPVQLQMHPGACESTESKDIHLHGKSEKVHYSTGPTTIIHWCIKVKSEILNSELWRSKNLAQIAHV